MATRSDGAAGGFLRGQLADGCRPFLYRARIRTLLGAIESDSFRLTLASALPVAAFARRRHHISRDVGQADHGADLQRQITTRELPASTRPTIAARPQQPAAPSLVDTAGVIQRAAKVHQVVIPGFMLSNVAPPNDSPTAAPAGSIEPHTPAGSAEPRRRPQGMRNEHVPTLHDVTIPQAHMAQQSSAPLNGTGAHEVTATLGATADSRDLPARFQRRRAAHGAATSPNAGSDSIGPVTSNASLRASDVMPTAGHQMTPAFDTQDSSARPRLSTSGGVSYETSDRVRARSATRPSVGEWSSHVAEPVGGDVFPARRANRRPTGTDTPRESGASQPGATEVHHSNVPAPPRPESPAVVVTQVGAPETRSLAFWERRHLSRLRDRVRR
jgi:hypothetical protein